MLDFYKGQKMRRIVQESSKSIEQYLSSKGY